MISELVGSVAHHVDGLFGFAPFEGERGGGLGAVEDDEAPEALVRGDILFDAAVTTDEIHQRQRVVGIQERSVVALKRQPGDAPMIILHEFAVGFGAMIGRHLVRRGFTARYLAASRRSITQVIEIGREAMRPGPIRSAHLFELEQAELDPDLEHHPAVARSHLSGDHFARLGLIGPALERLIHVSTHC